MRPHGPSVPPEAPPRGLSGLPSNSDLPREENKLHRFRGSRGSSGSPCAAQRPKWTLAGPTRPARAPPPPRAPPHPVPPSTQPQRPRAPPLAPPPPPRAAPLLGREEPPRPQRLCTPIAYPSAPPHREAPWAPPGGHRGEAAANQTGLTPPCGSAPSLVRHVAPGAREGPGEVLGVAAWCRHLANPSPARHELWGRPAAADTPATPGLPGGRGTGPNSEPLNSPPPGAKGTELSSGRRTPCGHPQPAMTEGEAPGCGDPVSAGGRGLLGEEGDRSATCMAVCHRSLRWLLGNSTRSSSPRAQGQFGTLSPGAVYTDSAAS